MSLVQEQAADPIGWASQKLMLAGLESPRLEAQLLLAMALGATRTAVIAGLFPDIGTENWQRFEKLIDARATRVPLAYLRGTQEFYGLEFEVGPAVLIPRPETEMLVDFALEQLSGYDSIPDHAVFADVGTGSGCIVIAALARRSGIRGQALDISAAALQIATRNAAAHGVSDRLSLIQSDLLENSPTDNFCLILSNPPYIATADLHALQPEVRDSEPRIALDGGQDGLSIYRRLAPSALKRLASGGALAVEVGMGQAPEVAEIFHSSGYREIEVRRDLAGIERLVAGYRDATRPIVKPEPKISVNRETGEVLE